MDEIKAKQQVVEKIKEADKILVTVSDNPSVDSLSAALGLALLLDKQEKYATAIFSGEVPPAIAFLEPEKTFDETTDSLRDFIIALNKEKADHLRYKVEGDSVKIFITPYKTTINQDDLEFSQGDYNVELVIAVGVDNQEHLDKALENHGQILHDAAIVTITAGDQTSTLGGIDWHDSNSSSLSEMVAGLAEALKVDKKKSLLDSESATALLTGIVAATDRFSNEHTTSKVMTVAASLMAAGADQQLIATELQQAHSISVDSPEDDTSEPEEATAEKDGTLTINQDPTKLEIKHDETLAELDERIRGEDAAREKIEDEIEAAEDAAEVQAAKREKTAIEQTTPKIEPATSAIHSYVSEDEEVDEPTFGGTLNATADQAEDDARRAIEEDQNKTILSHSYLGAPASEAGESAADFAPASSGFPGTPDVTPGSVEVSSPDVLSPSASEEVHSSYAPEETSESSEAPSSLPPLPTDATPADLGLPLPPPIPDFSQGLSAAIPTGAPEPQPAILGDILAPEPQPASLDAVGMEYETTNAVAAPGSAYAIDDVAPSLPPIEQFGTPPLPEPPVAPETPTVPQTPPPSTPPTPGQFQIPGQQ